MYFFEEVATGMMKNLYFETSAIIIHPDLLGKYLEAVAKGKTSKLLRNWPLCS
jgi:cation transport ATPase